MQLDKLVLGKSYPEVHRVLDLLPMALGLRHKAFHDPVSALIIGSALDGPEGALSALLHIYLDAYHDKNLNIERLVNKIKVKRHG
jgi:hypothetical protein